MLYIPIAVSPPSTFLPFLTPTFPLPQIHSSFLSQKKKRANLLGISTKHGITNYNKARYKPSWLGKAIR